MARSPAFRRKRHAGNCGQTLPELMIGARVTSPAIWSRSGRAAFLWVLVGDDEAGAALTKALGAHPLIEFHLVVDGGRQTTRKVRFVSEHHSAHLLRADWEAPSGCRRSARTR